MRFADGGEETTTFIQSLPSPAPRRDQRPNLMQRRPEKILSLTFTLLFPFNHYSPNHDPSIRLLPRIPIDLSS